jgi:hypothetical protein
VLRRRSALFQALALIVALVLGCVIFVAKVSAQPAGKGGTSGGGKNAIPAATPAATPAAAGAAVRLVLDAAPAAVDAAPAALATNAAVDAGAALDYAELQGEADFEGMSEEQKAAVGTGKVPIHKEGKFHSPFAHPRFGGPATAKVGLVLNNVREYDIQTGSFQADFFLSLVSDKPMPPVKLFFTNGHEVNETVLADTPTFKAYRYTGTFLSPVDLRSYPFDTQHLTIEVEDLQAGVDQLILEPYQERTSLDDGFVLSGWGTSSIGGRAYRHLYPSRFDRDDLYISRYKFSLGIERFATSAAFSVFVPAYIIVLISLVGMWVPPEELEVRSSTGAPMLAAAVFFHYTLTQALPATGYLTRADKLMLGVYVALLINMVSTWVFLIVQEASVEKAFKWGRAWVPPITVVLMLLVTII